jgi:hypothetical protein
MKLNAPRLAVLFFAATSVGLGIQLYQARQQLAEARRAPGLEVKRTEIHTAGAPAPIVSPATATNSPATSLPDPIAELTGEGGPGGPGNRGGPGGGARFAAQMAELLKDPEFAAAWKTDQEARIEERYGALFKQLNLPPDQLAAFKALLIDRENAGRDVWTLAREQGLNPRDPAARDQLRQLTSDLQAEVDGNIEAKFGAGLVTKLDAYNSSAPQRNTVNTLNQRLVSAGQPLNDNQSQMLTRILADTGTPSRGGVLITDATIARAQGVLMPSQVDSLKKLQAEQRARQLIADRTRAAREQAQNERNRN